MGGSRSLKVAVIGAGLAGLAAARELQKEGHEVVVFEKGDQVGGTWVYDPRVEADELGVDPNREIVHSSLYASLRTNLPRQIMRFSDYPFRVREDGDPRNFPCHEEVLRFINDFARDFGINELIRFRTEVVRVERVGSRKDQWVVESRTSESNVNEEELFEAVVVCSGHLTEPQLPNIAGLDKWPGRQVHSHNYRDPDPYQNQVVVIIGSAQSAIEISREITTVAKEVHLSSRSPQVKVSKFEKFPNMWQHSKIVSVCEDGTVAFEDGYSVKPDTIFHCTGYIYNFPFLKTDGIVTVDDNRLGPLYKQVFPPKLAPYLSFVGIPYRALIFYISEFQSKWIAGALSGKFLLPSEEQMSADVEDFYRHLEKCKIPKHHTHQLNLIEFGYQDWLAEQVGIPPLDKEIKAICRGIIMLWQKDQFSRDEVDIESLANPDNLVAQ